MRVKIVTSEKSVSLYRVAKDVADVFRKYGHSVAGFVLGPHAESWLYEGVDGIVTVMTFDAAWAITYFFNCWSRINEGKPCVFYTTVEGRPLLSSAYEWVRRDLSFVANSEYTKSKLEEVGVRVSEVVPHGIDLGLVEASKVFAKAVKARLSLPSDKFVVGYVAGCYSRKGHDLYAEVIKKVVEKDKDVFFAVLTGAECVSHYNLPNTKAYTLFGKLQEHEILAFYHIIDLYAQPSLSEGFGLPVLEALAAGKPVVHADYKPLTEITTPETSFRVPVIGTATLKEVGGIEYELNIYNVDEFANAIIQAKDEVLKNKDDIAAKCVERAKEFDKYKVYKRLVELM